MLDGTGVTQRCGAIDIGVHRTGPNLGGMGEPDLGVRMGPLEDRSGDQAVQIRVGDDAR